MVLAKTTVSAKTTVQAKTNSEMILRMINLSISKMNSQMRIQSGFYLSLMALTFASLIFGLSRSAIAETFKVRATHGHWHVSCGTPPGARAEKCALVQDVTDETRPNFSLRVIFLRSRDGKKEVLRVVAPLGVLLPTGLGLKIDNADIGHAPFMKCGKIGCIAEVVVDANIVNKFKTGKNAVFIIFQTPEAGIGFPISLAGFSAGYQTLN